MFSLLVVIHETLISAEDSKMLHADPDYYASYHAVIERTGKIIYFTPADSKAYAAAESVYINPITGVEEHINGSVDDFAYHIALETPPDGYGLSKNYHIGYTKEQYTSLAWLVKAVDPSPERITLHSEISNLKVEEPRCFNYGYFSQKLEQATNTKSINLGILDYGSTTTNS
jgi:N-acetyl-anhydromuramyl-L-alanine amidase AmpD